MKVLNTINSNKLILRLTYIRIPENLIYNYESFKNYFYRYLLILKNASIIYYQASPKDCFNCDKQMLLQYKCFVALIRDIKDFKLNNI